MRARCTFKRVPLPRPNPGVARAENVCKRPVWGCGDGDGRANVLAILTMHRGANSLDVELMEGVVLQGLKWVANWRDSEGLCYYLTVALMA